MAAEQGDAGAQYRLGLLRRDGKGVARDAVLAHMWFNLAAAGSSGEMRAMCAHARDNLATTMTARQIAEAQRLAREWMPQEAR